MTTDRKTILITGCSTGGIGYYLAKHFAARNYKVFATARHISNMGDLSTAPNITLLTLDINDDNSVQETHSVISSKTGSKLDIIYHNAGLKVPKFAIETSRADAELQIKTNFLSIVEMNRVFADLIIAAKGMIVNTGSTAEYGPLPLGAVYNASKAAMRMYANTLRVEMRPFGVRVVDIVTGGVRTDMWRKSKVEIDQGLHLISECCCGRSRRLMDGLESRYSALSKVFSEQFERNKNGSVNPDVYAESVVNFVNKKASNEFWVGYSSSIVWWIETLNLQWVYEWLFVRQFNLGKMIK